MNKEDLAKIIIKNKNTINIVMPTNKKFNTNTAQHREVNAYNGWRVKDLIHIDNIQEDLYKIDESEYDYITTSGNVYVYYGNNMFYKRNQHVNSHNGYIYVAISKKDSNVQRRLHVLLAKTFIPNQYSKYLKLVGHKNDDKSDYNLKNLYWTNNQENTQDATNKGFNQQPAGEFNESSSHVKVLDKNTLDVVGVYGSIRECARCIKNISMTTIAKMCRKTTLYKPRSRKYIYQIATNDELDAYANYKNKQLEESKPVDKSPKVFWLCNNTLGYQQQFDNQTQASKVCGISQAQISNMIKSGSVINGWYCVYLNAINYADASSYQNLINTVNRITIKNIHTNEIKQFDTSSELKAYLGFNGHDINIYLKTGHILMNEWKIIAVEAKQDVGFAS